jgi:ABC-2 type transport system permease protein
MFLSHVPLRISALLVPLLVLELFVFALAVAFFLSSVFVKFRDMAYIWEVFMQGAFYATPILYPLSLHPLKGQIPVKAAKILILNPVGQIIQEVRHALVTDQAVTINQLYSHAWAVLIPVTITLCVVLVAARYFRNSSKFFAEDV